MWPFTSQKQVETPESPVAQHNSLPNKYEKNSTPDKVSAVDPAGYFRLYGYPIPIHDVATRQEFVSCYDRALRNPTWVIEHLTSRSRDAEGGDRSRSHFKEDTSIPDQFRARLANYFRSGYDRGHQAPAADARFSQKAMDETFYLTNMAPQVGDGFNRDYWAHFERFCRNLTRKYSSVRIVTGPLYLPKKDPVDGKWRVSYEVIGNPPNIAVPTHFYKIIVGENPILPSLPRKGVAVGAFVLPNDRISNDTPLKSFEVPLNAIERAAGVEFLPKLPSSGRRALCNEIDCSIEIKEFNNAVRSLPPPSK